MTISREDIEKVAVLARIRVDDEQVSALEKDLGNILDLVDQLGAADTDSVAPMAHPLDAVQRLRADEVTETNPVSSTPLTLPTNREVQVSVVVVTVTKHYNTPILMQVDRTQIVI